jgi:hypothetical protein
MSGLRYGVVCWFVPDDADEMRGWPCCVNRGRNPAAGRCLQQFEIEFDDGLKRFSAEFWGKVSCHVVNSLAS